MKGEALAAMGCAEETVPLPQPAIENAREEREILMLWRVYTSLGRLYLALDRRSETENSFPPRLNRLRNWRTQCPTER